MSGDRSPAHYCPWCGEEDLEPEGDAGGGWHCRSCTRSFTVRQVRAEVRSGAPEGDLRVD